MKLIDSLTRRPTAVAFGRGPGAAAGTITPVALDSTRDADSVTITADDGSFVVLQQATAAVAGVLTANDKDKIDGLAAGSGSVNLLFADKAAAEAASIPAFQEFLRTAGYHAAGDGGGALYRRVGSQPSHALRLQSADGAHWELVPENGMISVLQAGARGDNSTDDQPAFMAAIEAFTDLSDDPNQGLNIVIPQTDKPYRLAASLEIRHRIRLVGLGFYDRDDPQLDFDNNIPGIILHNAKSEGVEGESGTTTTRGEWAYLERLTIRGGGSDPNAHGFTLRTKVRMRDCMAINFPGNGFHIRADSRGLDAPFGNVNNSDLVGLTAIANHRHGIYVQGFDSNAITFVSVNCSENGRFGLLEDSSLGNTWIGVHFDANGIAGAGANGSGSSCLCHYNGKRYFAVHNASENALVSTQPGTNDNVWRLVGNGSSSSRYLSWTGSNPLGTFHAGGPAAFTGSQNRGTVCGYIEPNQGGLHLNGRTAWIGGHNTGPTYGQGKAERGNQVYNGGQIYAFARDGEGAEYKVRIREGEEDRLMSFERDGSGQVEWSYNDTDQFWNFSVNRNFPQIMIPGPGHSMTAGRPEPIPQILCLPDGFCLGDPRDRGRTVSMATGPATGGDHARGEIRFNSSPSAGGNIGWVCVQSGTPGIWKPFGPINP